MQRHAPTVEETIKTASRLYVRRDIGRKRQAIGLFIEFLDDRANKRNNRHRLEHSYDQGQEAFEHEMHEIFKLPRRHAA